MCILVDTGDLPAVFNENHSQHDDFRPVKEWIVDGSGLLVYGCDGYMEELANMPNYVDLIIDLTKSGNAKRVPDDSVNQLYQDLINRLNDTACDDEHLIAIVKAASLEVVCVTDQGAHRFLQLNELYHSPTEIPSIYSDSSHTHLLSDQSIVSFCT